MIFPHCRVVSCKFVQIHNFAKIDFYAHHWLLHHESVFLFPADKFADITFKKKQILVGGGCASRKVETERNMETCLKGRDN